MSCGLVIFTSMFGIGIGGVFSRLGSWSTGQRTGWMCGLGKEMWILLPLPRALSAPNRSHLLFIPTHAKWQACSFPSRHNIVHHPTFSLISSTTPVPYPLPYPSSSLVYTPLMIRRILVLPISHLALLTIPCQRFTSP